MRFPGKSQRTILVGKLYGKYFWNDDVFPKNVLFSRETQKTDFWEVQILKKKPSSGDGEIKFFV